MVREYIAAGGYVSGFTFNTGVVEDWASGWVPACGRQFRGAFFIKSASNSQAKINLLIARIVLRGNAPNQLTNEFRVLTQRRRKRENKQNNWKLWTCSRQFLSGFFTVFARLTLSNLSEMAMRTSLLLSKIFALSVSIVVTSISSEIPIRRLMIFYKWTQWVRELILFRLARKQNSYLQAIKKMSVFYSLTSRLLTIVKVKILSYTVALKIHPVTERLLRD